MSSCEIRGADDVKVMWQISETEGKPLISSSKICPVACCTVERGGAGGAIRVVTGRVSGFFYLRVIRKWM